MRIRFIVPTVMLLALATGCGSSLDIRYLDASLGQPLELPPDLTISDSESEFELPTAFNGDDASDRDKIPVLAMIDSVQLKSGGGFYWLEVEEPVDDLYQLIKNYWSREGYGLIVDEPVIGVMQTEWIFREEGVNRPDASWWERILFPDDFSASQDQFRTRIERDPESQRNRVYIVHRGTEYKHVLQTRADDNSPDADYDDEWHFRRQEPELEVEMLSRLMVYLGLQKTEVDQQVADVRLFTPRAFKHIDIEENAPFLIVKDPYQIAWNRVYHQLERLNFEITSSQFSSGFGFLQEGVIIISTEITRSSDDEGFSFFSSSDVIEEREFALVFSEESHDLTRVEIEDINGEFDTSPEAARFIDILFNQVR